LLQTGLLLHLHAMETVSTLSCDLFMPAAHTMLLPALLLSCTALHRYAGERGNCF
jgi:hypothetical protein